MKMNFLSLIILVISASCVKCKAVGVLVYPDYESSWIKVVSARANDRHLKILYHGLGEVPLLVDVEVKDRNNEFIYQATGHRIRDDERSEKFGNVVYVYNEETVVVSAPAWNAQWMGYVCCLIGPPYWRGPNYLCTREGKIKVRAWKASSLPVPDYSTTGIKLQARSTAESLHYQELSHGFGEYPALVVSRIKLSPPPYKDYHNFYADSMGATVSMFYGFDHLYNGYVVYGFDETTIRVWASTHSKDYLFSGRDGHFERHNQNAFRRGYLNVYAWKTSSLTPGVTGIKVMGKSVSANNLRTPFASIGSVSDTFSRAWVKSTSGANDGFRFVGSGANAYSKVVTATPCCYGGLTYSYTASEFRFWQPLGIGKLICISDTMANGKNSQGSSDGEAVYHVWKLDVDDCANNLCQNGATCSNYAWGYTCTCVAGWTDYNCTTDIKECVSDPCQNNATCNDGVNQYTCSCAPGWEGTHCELNIEECVSDPCQNNATCNDGVNQYTCSCTPEWEGTHCELIACPDGSYCFWDDISRQIVIEECLPGHACLQREMTPCSSRYYQPMGGQADCLLCPVHQYCNQSEAILEKQSGSNASTHGVVTPKNCPKTIYCKSGSVDAVCENDTFTQGDVDVSIVCKPECDAIMGPEITFSAVCPNCAESSTYTWTMRECLDFDIDMCNHCTINMTNFSTNQNFLFTDHYNEELINKTWTHFSLILKVTLQDGRIGMAFYIWQYLHQPTYVPCDIKPSSGVAFKTEFAITCEYVLIQDYIPTYSVYIDSGIVGNPATQLVSGASPNNTRMILSPGESINVTLVAKVKDILFFKTVVNAEVTIPIVGGGSSTELFFDVLGDDGDDIDEQKDVDREVQILNSLTDMITVPVKPEEEIDTAEEKEVLFTLLVDNIAKINVSDITHVASVSTVLNKLTEKKEFLSEETQDVAMNTYKDLTDSFAQTEEKEMSEEFKNTAGTILIGMSSMLDAVTDMTLDTQDAATETPDITVDYTDTEDNTDETKDKTDNTDTANKADTQPTTTPKPEPKVVVLKGKAKERVKNATVGLLKYVAKVSNILLERQEVGQEPVVVVTKTMSIAVKKEKASQLGGTNIQPEGQESGSKSSFTFQEALDLGNENETIGLQVMLIKKNPYVWSRNSHEITSPILDITLKDSSDNVVQMTNLTEPVEMSTAFKKIEQHLSVPLALKIKKKEDNLTLSPTVYFPSMARLNFTMTADRIAALSFVVPENLTSVKLYIAIGGKPELDDILRAGYHFPQDRNIIIEKYSSYMAGKNKSSCLAEFIEKRKQTFMSMCMKAIQSGKNLTFGNTSDVASNNSSIEQNPSLNNTGSHNSSIEQNPSLNNTGSLNSSIEQNPSLNNTGSLNSSIEQNPSLSNTGSLNSSIEQNPSLNNTGSLNSSIEQNPSLNNTGSHNSSIEQSPSLKKNESHNSSIEQSLNQDNTSDVASNILSESADNIEVCETLLNDLHSMCPATDPLQNTTACTYNTDDQSLNSSELCLELCLNITGNFSSSYTNDICSLYCYNWTNDCHNLDDDIIYFTPNMSMFNEEVLSYGLQIGVSIDLDDVITRAEIEMLDPECLGGNWNVCTSFLNFSVQMTSYTMACMYWDDTNEIFSSDGCWPSNKTTPDTLECICDHMTAFASSVLVMPVFIDPIADIELFLTFFDNPVVVTAVLVVWMVYIFLAHWAKRADKQDMEKVGVIVCDNSPLHTYIYLVRVTTGWWKQAGTTAMVYIHIKGSEGVSPKRCLSTGAGKCFQSGDVNWFLITTEQSLGHLESVTLWHNNSGTSPHWYVNSVYVKDIQTKESWTFIYNDWLAVDRGNIRLTTTTLSAFTEEDMKFKQKYHFMMKSTNDIRDGHIWFSIFSKPARSTFTRVQRLTCALSLLLTTMLTNIMFYGIPTDDPDDQLTAGGFSLSLSQLVIGIESSIIMFPVNLLIVQLFLKVKPKPRRLRTSQSSKEQHQKYSKTVNKSRRNRIQEKNIIKLNLGENLTDDFKECLSNFDIDSFSEKTLMRTMLQQDILKGDNFFNGDEDMVNRFVSEGTSTNYSSVIGSGGTKTSHSSTVDDDHNKSKGLPWWFVYIAWIIVMATCLISSFFVMLYGLKYGYERSVEWLVSFFTGFAQSLFVQQPLKVICLSVVITLILKKSADVDEIGPDVQLAEDEEYIQKLVEKPETHIPYMKPLSKKFLDQLKHKLKLEILMNMTLQDMVMYLVYIAVIVLMVHGHRNVTLAYQSTETVKNIFVHPQDGISTEEVCSAEDFYDYIQETLLPGMSIITQRTRRHAALGSNIYLVGPYRFRQLRIKKGMCTSVLDRLFPDGCQESYQMSDEDSQYYNRAWSRPMVSSGVKHTSFTPWMYQTTWDLKTMPYSGTFAIYSGGGYVLQVPKDKVLLKHLSPAGWIDDRTRAVFIEFTLYNPNTNLFSIVMLLFEFSNVGTVSQSHQIHTTSLYFSSTDKEMAGAAWEVLFVLFNVMFVYTEIRKYRTNGRKAFFADFWNHVEILQILVSFTVVALFVKKTISVQSIIRDFHENGHSNFINFYPAAFWDGLLLYVMAFHVGFVILKMVKLLRFNQRINIIAKTVANTFSSLISFAFLFIIGNIAFGHGCYIAFGPSLHAYSGFGNSLMSNFLLLLGDADFEHLFGVFRFAGPIFVILFMLTLVYCLMTLFTIILNVGRIETKHKLVTQKNQFELMEYICNKAKMVIGIK